jgi:hypothetical protein
MDYSEFEDLGVFVFSSFQSQAFVNPALLAFEIVTQRELGLLSIWNDSLDSVPQGVVGTELNFVRAEVAGLKPLASTVSVNGRE